MSLERTDTRTDPHWADYDWGTKGNEWPIQFTGWVDGVEDSYEFDKTIKALAVEDGMDNRVMTDSESGQIFIYAADDAAADYLERTVKQIEDKMKPLPLKDASGMSVMLYSSDHNILMNAMMEAAYTKQLNGMNLSGCLVMVYHSDFNDPYRVNTLDPAFMDKFDIHINLDKVKV